jgi:hypothetical protein
MVMICAIVLMTPAPCRSLELALESQTEYQVGDTIYVDVIVDSAAALYGMALDLAYNGNMVMVPDSDGVTAGVQPEVMEGTALTADGENTFLRSALVDNNQGRLVLGNVRSGQVPGIDLVGRHTVMTVTFEATAPGTVDIFYQPESTLLRDGNLQRISIDSLVGTTITIYLQGDIDASGAIDLVDVIFALQIISGLNPGQDVVHVLADVNGDNLIGMEEALYDMRTIADIP